MTSPPHERLDRRVRAELDALTGHPDSGERPDPDLLIAYDAMCGSRCLDIQARRMREHGMGYYTIGSAGHEANALIALALRPTDPALLHYRSGAFFLARALTAGRPLTDPVRAVLLGMVAATADPASGGRHKVFGDASLAVIPQTSTIASHLPRAVGVAFAIGRARRLGLGTRWPDDAVTVCSFGDASVNHSTAAGALNTVGYCVAQGLPMPLVLICEDNGLGISVPSPPGWVEQALRRPGIRYLAADGTDPDAVRAVAAEAVAVARTGRRPTLVHLRTVRYLGHAGTDVETGYRTAAEIAADAARDPLIALARRLPPDYAAARYAEIAALVADVADEVVGAPQLTSGADVVAPLAPRDPDRILAAARHFAATDPDPAAEADRTAEPETTAEPDPGVKPDPTDARPAVTLAQAINSALADALAADPRVLVFGEDVGRKGGVYGLTKGLQSRFGTSRVFDSLLDEQSILGLGLGMGVSGLLPVPEIQYLAYLHNAEDQLRGEAASLHFFSDGSFTNPLVVRVAGLAYQKGFGGHFHNDNAVSVLRDIPGLVIGVPSRPEDAGPMLRTCLGAAVEHGQVSVLLEPIALYHERDLHDPGDQGWLGTPDAGGPILIGRARTHGDGRDLCIVTFGNGLRLALRAARCLAERGIAARVVDLRWLAPLPVADLIREARATGAVLVADETRPSGGVAEGVLTELIEHGFGGRMARVTGLDTYIPLGPAADTVLLSQAAIEQAAATLLA